MKNLSTLDLNFPVMVTGGGASRALPDRFADIINLKDQVAGTGQGNAATDTSAMTAALAKALAKPGSTIFIPAGTYAFSVPASSTLFQIPASTKIIGAGRDEVIITWNDDAGNILFGSSGTSAAHATNIILASFSVQGTAATKSTTNSLTFNLSYVDGLEFNSVGTLYSRSTAIYATYCTDVQVHGCSVKYSMGDGVNLQGCANVLVSDNRIRHIDGDAISINSDTLDAGKVRRNITVQGNRIFDAQGIRIMSARHLALSGNQMDSIRSYGINLSTAAPTGSGNLLGASSGIAVTISSNTITNLLSRTNIDGASSGCPGIILSGASARAGSYSAVPGENSTTTGTVIDPYRETFANANATSTPTAGLYAISINNNTIARTLPACNSSDARFNSWTDFGLGPIFTKSGNKSPTLAEADMRDAAIQLSGGVIRDVLITDNSIRGLDSGLAVLSGQRYDNIVFRSNNVIDCYSNGVLINTSGALRLYVDSNLFDLDPYLKHGNRGLNGTWQTSQGPTAINQIAGTGVYVRGNILRNLTLDCSANSTLVVSGIYFDRNIVEAQPAVYDVFSTSNKGVGLVHSNFGTLVSIADSDPTSSTFGSILSMPALPTSSLLGRASAGAGTTETIPLGSGLVMSNGALSVSFPSPFYANSIQASGAVVSFTITRQAGYPTIPPITLGAPPSGGSQAAAVVATMGVFSIGGLAANGSGYSANDVLTFIGGTGTAATIRVSSVDSNGGITAYAMGSAGSYSALPSSIVSLSGGTGSGAKLSSLLYAPLTGTITVAGGGYASPPSVSFPTYAGATAAGVTTLSNNFALTGGIGQLVMNSSGTAIGIFGAAGSSVIMSGAVLDQSKVRLTANGSAYTIPANTSWLVMNQTGTVSSQTLTMPTPTGDGQFLRISTIGAITALTLAVGSGVSVAWTAGSQLAANTSILFGWDAASSSWMKL